MRRNLHPLLLLVMILLLAVPASAGQVKVDPEKVPSQYEALSEAGVLRIAGANRYATAAAWSEATWDPSTTIAAYIVSGSALADSLIAAGGFEAGHSGPILYTDKNRIPTETVTELLRLQPCFIIIVGGEGVVSFGVEEQLASYAREELCVPE